jgi:hypothetical protein
MIPKEQLEQIVKLPAEQEFIQVLDKGGDKIWKEIIKINGKENLSLDTKGNFITSSIQDLKIENIKSQIEVENTKRAALRFDRSLKRTEKIVSRLPKPKRNKKRPLPAIPTDPIRKKEYMELDPISRIIRENPESTDVLKEIMLGLADEVSSMSYDRTLAEEKGYPTSIISNRRVSGLKALSEAWLRRKEQVIERDIDLNSPSFRNLLLHIVTTFKISMAEVNIPNSEINQAITKLSQIISTDVWEAEAKRRMLGDL